MIPQRTNEQPDLPEPLGSHCAPGFRPDQVERARQIGLSHLIPTETLIWTYVRPRVGGELWPALRQASLVAACLFGALTIWGTQELTVETEAGIGALALVGLIAVCYLWAAIRRVPRDLIPGFVAILTRQRLVVVNLDRPDEAWTLCVGQVLQVSSDTLAHNFGGVWVAGWWLDPGGRRVDTKVPLFVGRETAAVVQMLRRRLSVECLEMPSEGAA
jgi:hypothetical protein